MEDNGIQHQMPLTSALWSITLAGPSVATASALRLPPQMATTRQPSCTASCTARCPVAPAAAVTSTVSPAFMPAVPHSAPADARPDAGHVSQCAGACHRLWRTPGQ